MLPRSLAGPLPFSPGLPTHPRGRLFHPFQAAPLLPLRASSLLPGLPFHPLGVPVSLPIRSISPCEVASLLGELRSTVGPFHGLNRPEISTDWPGKSSGQKRSNRIYPEKATRRDHQTKQLRGLFLNSLFPSDLHAHFSCRGSSVNTEPPCARLTCPHG